MIFTYNSNQKEKKMHPLALLCRRTPILAITAVTLLAGAPAYANEPAPTASAESLLGADVKGENWTVAPVVRSDGFLWLFDVKTPYGDFQVNGKRRMTERLQELRALQVLEKMSRTKAFGDALAKAGMAPIHFGHDLIVDPVETTGNLLSGVAKTFNNAVASVSDSGASRDPFFDSVVGITKAERDLAFELHVDPYSDFTPLREGLEDVARASAAGDLSVTAALSAIPGGAGIAVSSTSTASNVAGFIYSKTSIEIIELVRKNLKDLDVDEDTASKFVKNTFYSPSDLYTIVDALGQLHAANSAAFISSAAAANSFDVAKFNTYRAELLAKESSRLGTLKDFVIVSDTAINHDAKGRLVAALPFDEVVWTDAASNSLTRLSGGIAALREAPAPEFATTGALSTTAESQLKKLSWWIVKLD